MAYIFHVMIFFLDPIIVNIPETIVFSFDLNNLKLDIFYLDSNKNLKAIVTLA